MYTKKLYSATLTYMIRLSFFLNGKKVLLSKAESKMIYKEHRNRVIIQPTAQFENDNLNWKKIFSLPFGVTLDTKSREFQYKLLNRCIATNAFLCKIGILSSPACSFGEKQMNPWNISLYLATILGSSGRKLSSGLVILI